MTIFAGAVYRAWQGGVWRGSMSDSKVSRYLWQQGVYFAHEEERKLMQLQRAA
jgi:hypothetical protein